MPQSFSASKIAARSASSAVLRTVQASFRALIDTGASTADDAGDDEEVVEAEAR